MARFRKQLLAVASATATAGIVVLSGIGIASAAAPTARPGVSGTEHLQIMTTSPTSDRSSFIASGAFTAGGVDISGNRSDTVRVPGGTFTITHVPGRGGSQHLNPKTCLGTISIPGTYTLGHGTGKYAGISGHGKFRLNILAIFARNSNGACSQKKPPLVFQQVITAHGPARL